MLFLIFTLIRFFYSFDFYFFRSFNYFEISLKILPIIKCVAKLADVF